MGKTQGVGYKRIRAWTPKLSHRWIVWALALVSDYLIIMPTSSSSLSLLDMCSEFLREGLGGAEGRLLLRSLLKTVELIMHMDHCSTRYL